MGLGWRCAWRILVPGRGRAASCPPPAARSHVFGLPAGRESKSKRIASWLRITAECLCSMPAKQHIRQLPSSFCNCTSRRRLTPLCRPLEVGPPPSPPPLLRRLCSTFASPFVGDTRAITGYCLPAARLPAANVRLQQFCPWEGVLLHLPISKNTRPPGLHLLHPTPVPIAGMPLPPGSRQARPLCSFAIYYLVPPPSSRSFCFLTVVQRLYPYPALFNLRSFLPLFFPCHPLRHSPLL